MKVEIKDQSTAAEFLATRAVQLRNCRESLESERWTQEHYDSVVESVRDAIAQVCAAVLPSGSGFNSGTEFHPDESDGAKLVFATSYHHMDEFGSYDGWTEHKVTVRPNFVYTDITISGRDRNNIKEVIDSEMSAALATRIVAISDSREAGFSREVMYVPECYKDAAYSRFVASRNADTIESDA